MIGDREDPRDDGQAAEDWGPLDAMVRMNPPMPDDLGGVPMPPAWVERYARLVVIRHTFPSGDSTGERSYPSEAQAVRGMAAQVASLYARGYTRIDD